MIFVKKSDYLFKNVSSLKGVGTKLSQYLKNKKIEKINDLLWNLPRSFTDRSDQVKLNKLEVGKIQTVKIKVPEGTQTGKVFRLRGKGIPSTRGRGVGDELVKVIVETPTKLNSEQKKLLKAFEDSLKDKNTGIKEGFFNKLKDLFK